MTEPISFSDKASAKANSALAATDDYFKAHPSLGEMLPLLSGAITMSILSRRAAVKALVLAADKRGASLTKKEAKALISGVTGLTFLVARVARSSSVGFDRIETSRIAYEAEQKANKAVQPIRM